MEEETKQISARIPLDLYREMRVKLAQEGGTMTALIQGLLERWVAEGKRANLVQCPNCKTLYEAEEGKCPQCGEPVL